MLCTALSPIWSALPEAIRETDVRKAFRVLLNLNGGRRSGVDGRTTPKEPHGGRVFHLHSIRRARAKVQFDRPDVKRNLGHARIMYERP